MDVSFSVAARSVTGLIRSGNEDSAFTGSHLIAVADGMGGHAGGEVASAIAIQIMGQLAPILRSDEIDSDSFDDLLLSSLESINEEINRVARDDQELTGMGTTLSALALLSSQGINKAALLHIGDSRCYRLRANTLLQLSHDHTVLQELLDQGSVTLEEAAEHPQKSFLTQALMGESEITPILETYELAPSDRFLVCSDGLFGFVTEKIIKQGLKIADKGEALSFLVDAAFAAGAPDNVTVLIADLATGPSREPDRFLGAALHE